MKNSANLKIRRLFIVLFIILISNPVFAQKSLKDVPSNHWAYEAVHDLIKKGVTTGFPDGTFKGKKLITRYEIAAMLSKFSHAYVGGLNKEEKILAELKSELALIKYKQKQAEKGISFSGEVLARSRLKLESPRQARADYRLKLALTKRLDKKSYFKIRLDTLDTGFNIEGSRAVTSELIDFESNFSLGGINYQVLLGPGDVIHYEDVDFSPSHNYRVYRQPKPSISAVKGIKKLVLATSYVARKVKTTGSIGVHEIFSKISYDFGRIFVYLKPRYVFEVDGPEDRLIDLGLNYKFSKKIDTNFLLSVGDYAVGRSGLYAKFITKLKDPWKTGTYLTFRLDKVGSQYRHDYLDEYEFIALNNFNRYILDGTVDIGLKIKQKLKENLYFDGKADYVTTGGFNYGQNHAGTYALLQGGFSFDLATNLDANIYYRLYQVPSGVDQFLGVVPSESSLVGVAFKRSF